MTQTIPIPYHIELRKLYRGSDRDEHELKFGVVGIEEPASVIVASDLFANPEIIQHLSAGGMDLAKDLSDRLALKCFKLMASQIIEHDGESGAWSIPDLSAFLMAQFSAAEAEILAETLSKQVTDGLTVTNVCTVADDDAI